VQPRKSLAIASTGLLAAGWVGCALLMLSLGCGLLLRSVGPGDTAPRFELGALHSIEAGSIEALDDACARAVEILGYESIESDRESDTAHWRALTAGGDPVDIELVTKGSERTEVRIRVGEYGDEARSRLILEQIRLSL